MKKEFWLERWERAETGFHEGVVNAYLKQYWQELQHAGASTVFVPLCGKSVDMQWLRQQGHAVIGVELSEIAAQAFFGENGYIPVISSHDKFSQYEANNIRILCGDFFDLKRGDVAGVSAVYDRASMVALPPEMRQGYVQHLLHILPPKTQILLVTFDYPQAEMPGPPFALAAEEVEALFGKQTDIKLLARFDMLAQNPRFQQRGLSRLQESVYLLTLK
ncbi:MAG: thiopurine S-methyltransferase [Gallionellales bacterium 35-53-114]|jgi:thiopurine S-methyltransferase|nr:MAG: thiopurine S-methyltransferase [Gallionellales bacterium 35-53-114]OYZ65435.1 MAG: thiopurine S-methyltransferase [Gallionellales bacterium 24-53-125]OZB08341.1 MAG: thiopurine S-methyltransferase [Gallionellales bacterium 39-52-133]HQS58283.1 thiopurine S-methyltransferase [Gallionellaceae bacterium]HQS73838.1 thiopurine S-methyltransferase [Gallionellaceae bacterium]